MLYKRCSNNLFYGQKIILKMKIYRIEYILMNKLHGIQCQINTLKIKKIILNKHYNSQIINKKQQI